MGINDKRRPRWLVFRKPSGLSSSSSPSMLKETMASKIRVAVLEHFDFSIHIKANSTVASESMISLLLDESYEHSTKHSTNSKGSKREREASSRGVSFSSEYDCVYIPQRTVEEKLASFYSKEDYDRIDIGSINTIMKMEMEKKYPDSETEYFRGLLTPRARYEKLQRIKFVVSKVLQEQKRSNNILSEAWVSEFSKQFSSQTAAAALCLGMIDASAARGERGLVGLVGGQDTFTTKL